MFPTDFRFYEVVLSFRQQSTTDSIESFFAQITSSLSSEEEKVNIVYSEYWGKRKLAYQIEKNSFAHMYYIRIKSTPGALAAFKKQIKISDDIIRHFIVKLDSDKDILSTSFMLRSLSNDIASSVTSINERYASVLQQINTK